MKHWWYSKVFVVVFVSLWVFLPNLSGKVFALDGVGSISGTVYAENGETPIPNTLVVVESADYSYSQARCADPNGYYEFQDVPLNVAVRLKARSNPFAGCDTGEDYPLKYWPNTPNEGSANFITLTEEFSSRSGINFTLAIGGSISGTVLEFDGVTPIANMFVAASGPGYYSGVCTDATGHFSITPLPLDVPFQLQAYTFGVNCSEWKDFVSEYWPQSATPGGAGSVTLTAAYADRTDILFTLDAGGSVSGTTYTADGNTILPRTVVFFQNDSNTFNNAVCSDENGHYILHGIPLNTSFRVRANSSTDSWCNTGGEYKSEFWQETVLQGNATYLTLAAGNKNIENINFTLDIAGVISGTVYATDGVTAIPNALVSLFEDNNLQNMVTCSDANGNYIFHSVPFNISYRVQARSNQEGDWCNTGADYSPEYWQHTMYDWQATPVTLTTLSPTQSNIDFMLDLAGSISGTVYDADGVTPLSNIYVSTDGNSDYSSWDCTDALGHYTLSGLPVGIQFQVYASPVWAKCSEWKNYVQEYWPETVDSNSSGAVGATAENRDVTNINFTLDAGGEISGTIHKTDGVTPLHQIAVAFETDDRRYHQSVCSDENGNYTIHGVPLNIPFRVRTDSYRDNWCDSGGDYTSEYWQESATSPGAALLTLTELSPIQSNVNFTVDQAGSISGTVYEADGVTPVPNMIVSFFGNGHFGINTACTDSVGHYTLHNVPFNVGSYVYTDKGGNTWCGDTGNYALQFWPEKADLDGATLLTVNQENADLTNIDFVLNTIPLTDANIDTWYLDEMIHAYDWPLDTHLTLKIEDPNTPQFPDYETETDVTDTMSWGPTVGIFNLKGQFDIQPGMYIFISGGTINRFMLVDNLTITKIDQETDTITGTARPNDWLWAYYPTSCCRSIPVSGKGIWSVDYSVPGSDDEPVADIGPGSGGTINMGMGYGNTSVDWYIPAKTLHVVPKDFEIHGHDWAPGSTVTLTVDSDANAANGVLYTETRNVDSEPLECGYPCFDLSNVSIVTLQAGQYVTLSDGINTKTVRISPLNITEINLAADTVSGIADPGSRVAVNIWSQNGVARYVTAGSDGKWIANFSIVGDEDFEQELATIQPNDSGRAIQLNPDGTDDGTLQYWDVSLPVVNSIARANTNPTHAASVNFIVTFSENVKGVNINDFVLTKTGVSGASVSKVVGSDNTYIITVNTGSGNGTIRLDVVDNDSIRNEFNIPLGGEGISNANYKLGEEYDVAKSAPGIPALLSPVTGTLIGTLQPTLDWKDSSPAADYYQLQVSTTNSFVTPFINETSILTSNFPLSDLTPGKLYYWRVRAFNALGGGSAWSTVWTFKTPLAKPVLVSPIDDAPLTTDRPVFDWDSVDDASQYHLQVSAVSNFSTLLVDVTLNLTGYTVTKDLPQNKILFWRVQSKSPAVNSPWSTETFKTGNPPSVPVLVSPAAGVLIKDYTPLFNWNNSTVPSLTQFVHYQIQVDDNSDFSSIVIDDFTADGLYTKSDYAPDDLHALAQNTKYYWRVRAISKIGEVEHTSGWSSVWSFRTVIAAPTGLTKIDTDTLQQPKFDWSDATGTVTNYTIQISTSVGFSTFIVNSTSYVSEYEILKNLPLNKTIYWRVRVNGANGPSAWTYSEFKITSP